MRSLIRALAIARSAPAKLIALFEEITQLFVLAFNFANLVSASPLLQSVQVETVA